MSRLEPSQDPHCGIPHTRPLLRTHASRPVCQALWMNDVHALGKLCCYWSGAAAGDQAFKNACRIRRTFPGLWLQLLHARDWLASPSPQRWAEALDPRARSSWSCAARPGSPALPFAFGRQAMIGCRRKPLPAAPPSPPLRVGRAGDGTQGLGSVRNALKRRRAAPRQRRPA